MIARHWRGLARADRARDYEDHLLRETLPALGKIDGFVDVAILTRRVETGVEFLVITRWASMDAIATFAGSDVEAAVVPGKVRQMMIEYDAGVKHYEVVK
jgi:heme-degrading monooxygenase HmoA